jgi:hypothetical protein
VTVPAPLLTATSDERRHARDREASVTASPYPECSVAYGIWERGNQLFDREEQHQTTVFGSHGADQTPLA